MEIVSDCDYLFELTEGKIYTIIRQDEFGDIVVKNDLGWEKGYHPGWFRPIGTLRKD